MFLLALAAALLGGVPEGGGEAAPRPNIVVLLCDDLGYGDLGCFGHPRIQTPVIDRLATEGARLTSLYGGAPVCSPSRAGLFSGQNPNRLGIRDWIRLDSGVHLPRSTVTVASVLKAAGYRTCLSGKWHLNSRFNDREPTPGDFGFDHWFATQNNTKHQDPSNLVRNGQRVGLMKGHATAIVVDEAIRFIDADQTGAPFAVFVTFHAPHEQIETPEAYTKLYEDVSDPTVRDYFGSVSMIDHEVGRLLKALDSRGLRDRTLVLFTSDNGPEAYQRYPKAIHSHGSAAPLRGMKLTMFEGGLRVPGVIRWPGHLKPGTEITEPIAFQDVLPTFRALAGVSPTEARLDGVSVLPILAGGKVERPIPLHWQYDSALDAPWRIAVREGPWKLLANAERDQFALFNLEADIGETHDRAGENPEVVQRLRADLERLYVPPTD